MHLSPSPTPFVTAKNGKGWDYQLPSEDVGISYQEYEGDAPDSGWWVNTVCWESYFVVDGTATVHVDDKAYEVKSKDIVVMLPGQKVQFRNAKHFKIVTVTKPNFYESQAKIVQE